MASSNQLLIDLDNYGYQSESIDVATVHDEDNGYVERGYVEAVQFITHEVAYESKHIQSIKSFIGYPFTIQFIRKQNGETCLIYYAKGNSWSHKRRIYRTTLFECIEYLDKSGVKPDPSVMTKGVFINE